ncbi:unnamed protein product [Rotaria sp. Silwood1]|nr:unnamed protein product [Rotaria sp. Silwood1]
MARQCFITDGKANVTGVILATVESFINGIQQLDIFGSCVPETILRHVVISYDGEDGFNQAIDSTIELRDDIKFIHEKKVLARYFNEVFKDGSHYCFGVYDTFKALDMGSIETLIIWENVDVNHYFLRQRQVQEIKTESSCVVHQDKQTDFEWEHIEEMPLLEWLVKNHKKFGSPFDLFVDGERNNVYVADTGNHRVQKFNLKAVGSMGITVAGSHGPGSGFDQLYMPWAVYIDKNKNVYAADTNKNRIQMWARGAASGVIVAGKNDKGKGLNQIGAGQSVFVHEETNALFMSNFCNDRIVKWIPEKVEGVIVADISVSGTAANQLNGSRDIFIDQCETIYVADLWNNRVQKWKKSASEGITVAGGNEKDAAANQLNSSWDVEVARYGNIFVADTDNSRFMKWALGATEGVQLTDANA